MTETQSKPTYKNLIDRIIHESEPWLAEQKERLRPAAVLDPDSQELSSGSTILEDDGSRGVFWPQAESPLDKSPGIAATLLVADGRRYDIKAFWPCQCAVTHHFHFHSLLVPSCQMAATPTRKIEARIIGANGEIGFATFDSIEIGDRIGLVLDRGQGPGISPTHFFPDLETLTTDAGPGFFAHYVGPSIDVRDYLNLPPGRRGFVLTD